ncbi:ferritin-like domain-containing protein [Deinococcus sp. Marseille-Q6407]|uniref:ferritin-like domain-containing protein n=1 Tax=Deinococcus sp. Marseille-Q6407 TaxID=2969223 RepID=UPI0021BE198C|nr:ferritin-like domain-containing protein [Deinococcus sp. Marseille-Q6407]
MRNFSLRDLYLSQLRDLYSAETQLLAALPNMAVNARDAQLKQGFEDHLAQTREHVQRLEQIFAALNEPTAGKVSKAMQGLVQQGAEEAGENKAGPVRDAALIASAQRVEHYEIAAYGTAVSLARLLGEDQAAALLDATLQEEGQTDEKLTQVAGKVNQAALQETAQN